MYEFNLVKHPWMGKGERIRKRQGESSDSDASLTFVKGAEVKKIGQEKLQTTMEFWDSLGQCDEESLGKCFPLKKFVLEGWPSFTAPSVLSHCLGVIAWRSKDRGWGGERGRSEHSSGSKSTGSWRLSDSYASNSRFSWRVSQVDHLCVCHCYILYCQTGLLF